MAFSTVGFRHYSGLLQPRFFLATLLPSLLLLLAGLFLVAVLAAFDFATVFAFGFVLAVCFALAFALSGCFCRCLCFGFSLFHRGFFAFCCHSLLPIIFVDKCLGKIKQRTLPEHSLFAKHQFGTFRSSLPARIKRDVFLVNSSVRCNIRIQCSIINS